MAERDEGARVQVGLRLREGLRAVLEAEAKRHDVSLNSEIVARLKGSLRDEEMGGTVFRDRATFILVEELARLLHFVEQQRGKRWVEDRNTLLVALKMFEGLIEMTPRWLAAEFPESLRDFTSHISLADLDRLREDAEERQAASPEEQS